MNKKKVPQTKVHRWQSKWWYWNKHGKRVGPFDTAALASSECSMYLRRTKFKFLFKKVG